MTKRTVILLYPDQLNHDGRQVYVYWSRADEEEEAIKEARESTVKDLNQNHGYEIEDPDDFALVGTFEGHLTMSNIE